MLSQEPNLVVAGEAVTLAEAVRQTQKLKPDVILMDVRLPDGSGIDACREILAARPDSRVVFLTSYSDDDSVLAAGGKITAAERKAEGLAD